MTTQTIIPPAGQDFPHYALFMDRLIALMIDIIVLGFFSVIILIPLSLATAVLAVGTPWVIGALMPGGNFFILALYWLYFAGMESGPRNATLGKRAMKIKVLGEDGQPLTFARASLRFIGKVVSAWPLLLGFFLPLITRKKQALHDFIASSVVVDA